MRVITAMEVPRADVERVFDEDGGDPATCSCQWFRLSGPAFEALDDEQRRGRLRTELAAAGSGPGVVAVRDDEAVGWCGAGPLAGYPRLRRSPLLRGVADAEWAITCFVVPRRFRRQGVARALLAGAVEHARTAGAGSLVAVPVDVAARTGVGAAELYHGPLTLFLEAGFHEVARPSAARAVVRLDL